MGEEVLNDRRCDKCACWVRLTEDNHKDSYILGHCKSLPPVVIMINGEPETIYPLTSYQDGCIKNFILKKFAPKIQSKSSVSKVN